MRIPGLFAALFPLALASCASIGPARDATMSAGSRYVALGSSFAAGAGIGPLQPDSPERCGRTTNNYASLLAQELRLDLDDRSCGGATTAHLLGPWDELAPQLDAVGANTRLVTITVGGNDLNYVGLLFMAGCDPATGLRFGDRAIPCQTLQEPPAEKYAAVETALRELVARVRRQAPGARIVFVQYVTLVPQQPCARAKISGQSASLAAGVGLRLAEITARVARQAGADVLAADVLSREHTPCDADPWSIGLPADHNASQGAPWHPNAAGHRAIARHLADMLGRG